jgi:methanethiol S-methyltransferase
MSSISFSVRRPAILGYAGLAYLAFVGASIWGIGFLADLGVPGTVDGPGAQPAWRAIAVDTGLLLVFAIQHSVMARTGWKARMVRVLPDSVERSTYVLTTSLALALLFWQWQPLPAVVWALDRHPWVALLWLIYGLGWLIAITATFMVDHLDFVGLRQASWLGRAGRYRPPDFTIRGLYAWVRHPMMLGLLIAFWSTPRMTVGHLFFAAAASGYIAVGVSFEERDLRRQLGSVYRDYALRVPAIVPSRPRAELRRPAQRSSLVEAAKKR